MRTTASGIAVQVTIRRAGEETRKGTAGVKIRQQDRPSEAQRTLSRGKGVDLCDESGTLRHPRVRGGSIPKKAVCFLRAAARYFPLLLRAIVRYL